MGVSAAGIGFVGIHHVGVLCENLERSLEFYCGILGMFFAITITCIQSDLVKHPYHKDMNESEEVVRHFIALQAHTACTYQRPVGEICITLWALTYEPWFCIYEVHFGWCA